jgi:hypothetical protein
MSLSFTRGSFVFQGGDFMKKPLSKTKSICNRKPIERLSVVQNFKKVIECKDIGHMKRELYEFFNLHCGFIAHYDINGFRATYSRPEDFADVFIRHFDSEHRYFDGAYPCHDNPYKGTGYTKADVKQEFFRIVDRHKNAIIRWAEKQQRNERYATYLKLKNEFGGGV